MIIDNLWSTSDICNYYRKTKKEVRAWRDDGLKSVTLSGAYYYKYSDIFDYLMGEE